MSFLSDFEWLRGAASSGGYLAFGTQLVWLVETKTGLTFDF